MTHLECHVSNENLYRIPKFNAFGPPFQSWMKWLSVNKTLSLGYMCDWVLILSSLALNHVGTKPMIWLLYFAARMWNAVELAFFTWIENSSHATEPKDSSHLNLDDILLYSFYCEERTFGKRKSVDEMSFGRNGTTGGESHGDWERMTKFLWKMSVW